MTNTQALREQLLLLLRTTDPLEQSLVDFVYSLDDFMLVAQIEMVETIQVETIQALRGRADLPALRIH